MQEGTKKLFPTDYERFKEAMISAANDNSLPVALQLDDIRDYTLRDLQDAFSDFNNWTYSRSSFFPSAKSDIRTNQVRPATVGKNLYQNS